MNSKLLFINSAAFSRLLQQFHVCMWLRLFITAFLLHSFPQTSFSQSNQESLIMGPVLMDSMKISGNFGELRGNHFHSGIDFKTNEKEGNPVFAAAEGYISRVKVSSTGYGRAIYITHPNEIVTVYGHMRIFYPALEDTVRKLQTTAQNYEMEFFPDSGSMPVQLGAIIGFSGNSGSSEGPHLHFETRHRASEKPFNPELVGYPISDTISPEMRALAIYYPGPSNGLAGSSRQLIEINDSTRQVVQDTLVTGDRFFVGFEAIDKAGQEENHLGIRSWSLFLDDSLVFNARIDSFSFDETRMINATIDYSFYAETGRKIVLCYVLKGNRLSFLENKNGMLFLSDSIAHKLKLKVEDTSGNITEAWYYIRKNKSGKVTMCYPEGQLFLYGNSNQITTQNYKIQISPLSFYEDIWLEHSANTHQTLKTVLLSQVVSIGPKGIPIHEPLIVSIKPKLKKTDPTAQLIAVRIDSTGRFHGIKSKHEKDWITFKTRDLGDFAIMLDTIPPLIKLPFWEPDDYSGKKKLILELEVDLSGIASSKCFINDMWVASVYNSGKNRITVYPEYIPETANTLKVTVELMDGTGNKAKYEHLVTIIR